MKREGVTHTEGEDWQEEEEAAAMKNLGGEPLRCCMLETSGYKMSFDHV